MKPDPTSRDISAALADAANALALLRQGVASIELEHVACECAAALRNRGKILACGNGGSACDAAHFCEELTGRFRADRPSLAALACNDAGHITCVANDYGFDHVFSRWIQGVGRSGDVVILLSTSGNSASIVNAARAANDGHLRSVALLGRDGGAMRGLCNHEIIVPGDTSDRIQELHMLLLHALVERIEKLVG